MKKILITGSSGHLGWHLSKIASERFIVHGTYFQNQISDLTIISHKIDLTDVNLTTNLLSNIQPDVIIHSAAISNINLCEKNPKDSRKINVECPIHLAIWAKQKSIPFLWTSTDLVFDGQRPQYKESDIPNPISQYGNQKYETESKIIELNPHATICRLPLLYGISPTSKNFLMNMYQSAKKKISIDLFTDEYRTPIWTKEAAKGILFCLNQEITGIIHIGGRDRLSRYEFGKLWKNIGFPDAKINDLKQSQKENLAPRPKDVSLNSDKIYKKGFQLLNTTESLKEIFKVYPI